MRLMGIDPGFADCGWALVDFGVVSRSLKVVDLGVIRTEKSDKKQKVLASDDNYNRARTIAGALRMRMLQSEHPVNVVCAESMSFPRNASSAAKVAICWGIMADICESLGISLLMATPKQIKKAVTGSAGASKEEVMAALDAKFAGVPRELLQKAGVPAGKYEHPYDALASVLACMGSEQVQLLLSFSSESSGG